MAQGWQKSRGARRSCTYNRGVPQAKPLAPCRKENSRAKTRLWEVPVTASCTIAEIEKASLGRPGKTTKKEQTKENTRNAKQVQ